ncbi:hypothetical protein ANN_28099 [Periplaneta americana]|uniref:MADF domain-containing protein n=1 Tax=Periplaneta americana TaxID=6978 RepID=A0ABQ8RUX1_PERAM|nr:hypothetical protein ANN_28099 [Periplaneta americana]
MNEADSIFSGPECKVRWVSLRDLFRKALKKRKTKSGQATNTEKKWKYEDYMLFLIPFIKKRETIGNVEPQGSDDSNNQGEEESLNNDTNEETAEIAASHPQDLRKSVLPEARTLIL